jgi:protein arginine kinase
MRFHETGPWIEQAGPDSDVVVSSRARLARNLSGFPFVNQASDQQQHEIVQIVRSLPMTDRGGDDLAWIDMDAASLQDRQLLFERHLVSRQFVEASQPRAVAVGDEDSLSVMVNEEDHLRMQVLLPGLRLEDAFHRVQALDQGLDASADLAVHPRWGYLTACPTNLGTACRLSVMLHLPGLRITNEMERVRRAAKDLHLAVRGFYGEGSESTGDFYQVSNQVTLGVREEDLLKEFQSIVVPQLIDYEREARRMLMERNLALLDDRIHRAVGLLRSARLLGIDEAMKLLSRVRLGVALGRLESIDMATTQRLFLELQPAHLLHRHPEISLEDSDSEREEPTALRTARANEVRAALAD